jgi:hypothetical protein
VHTQDNTEVDVIASALPHAPEFQYVILYALTFSHFIRYTKD